MTTELEDLQTRIAFQEDTIAALNDQLAEQGQTIQALQKQMRELNRKLNDLSYDLEQSGTPAQERPPHY